MPHTVPEVLAKNKELVTIYAHHGNRYVSPGPAIYTHKGAGVALIVQACQGQSPQS